MYMFSHLLQINKSREILLLSVLLQYLRVGIEILEERFIGYDLLLIGQELFQIPFVISQSQISFPLDQAFQYFLILRVIRVS